MLELESIFTPFRAVLGNYNYWLTTSPPAQPTEIVPATSYLDQTILRAVIQARADQLGTTNLKVAASDWQLYYNRANLPLILLAMTLGGVGLDGNINNVRLILAENIPHSIILPDLTGAVLYAARCQSVAVAQYGLTSVSSVAELQSFVFRQLFQQHFRPLFETLQAATHISKNILWGNLANSYYSLYNFLNEIKVNPTACQEDSQVILEQPYNPNVAEGKNPLYQPFYNVRLTEPTLPETVAVRRSCCLFYHLPGYGKCTNCPLLKLPERQARWQALKAKR